MCSGLVEMKVWMRGRSADCERLGGAVDVLAGGARQAATVEFFTCLDDFADGFEIAVGGDREAGFDHVDAHLLEHRGDAQLLLEVHRGAGRLLAVAQGGVEDDDSVGVGYGSHCSIPLMSCC